MGGIDNSDLEADAAAFGITLPEQYNKPKNYELWQINAEVFELIILGTSQLRTSFGGVVGLDYNGLYIIAKGLGIGWNKELMLQINGCEKIISRYLNK